MSSLVRFSFRVATKDMIYGRSCFTLSFTFMTYRLFVDNLNFGRPTSISSNPLSARTIPYCDEKSGLFGLYSILRFSASIPSMSRPTNGITSKILSILILGRNFWSLFIGKVMTGISEHSLASPNY
jgi:hypothetical protein